MRIRFRFVLAAGAVAASFAFASLRAAALPPAPSLAHSATHVAGSKIGLDAMLLPVGSTKLALVRIAAATFTQGAAAADDLHDGNELPAHKTTITNDFYLAETPTTRAQFEAFVSDSGYKTEAERGTSGGSGWNGSALVQGKQYTWRTPGFAQTEADPVVLVTFDDAKAFASWASAKTGHFVRLPTEAEWELGARAGTTTRFYSGDDKTAALGIGWFKENAGQGTKPVAQKTPNKVGLFDMSGDVWEWCADAFAPYSAGPATDPLATTGEAGQPLRRVLRGGSWLKDSSYARSSARYRNTPGSRNADNGFRVAVDLSTSPAGAAHKPLLPTTTATTTATATAAPTSTGASGASSSGGGSTSGGGLIIAILLGLVAAPVAIIMALVITFRKQVGRGGSKAAQDPNEAVTTRNGADGFFLVAPTTIAGSRVQYRALVNGTWRSAVVPLAGAETFVYTGTPPASVNIFQIMGPAAPAWRQGSPPNEPYRDTSSSNTSSSSSDDGSYLGSPRAY